MARSDFKWDGLHKLVIFLLLSGYVIIMVNVAVLAASLPALIVDKSMSFGAKEAGMILGIGTAANAVGKFIHSGTVNYFNPKTYFVLVLIGAAMANVLFPLGASTAFLASMWFLSRFATAAGWLAAVKLVKAWFPPDMHAAVVGYLGFSSRTGSFVGTAGLGALLSMGFTWRQLFVFSSILALATAFIAYALMPLPPLEDRRNAAPEKSDKDDTHGPVADDHAATTGPTCKARTLSEALAFFATSPRVWLMVAARALYCMLFEIQHFLPMLLRDTLRVDPGYASQLSSFFSVGAGLSVLVGGRTYAKLNQEHRFLMMVGLGSLATISLGGMLAQQASRSIQKMMPLVFLSGVTLSTPHYIPYATFNMNYGGKFAMTLEGLSEFLSYLTAVGLDLGVGYLVHKSGDWRAALGLLMSLGALGTLFIGAFELRDGFKGQGFFASPKSG